MNVGYLLLIGIAVMLLLALGVVFFVVLYQRRVMQHDEEVSKMEERRRQELLQASIRAEETERRRIAEELHDDVGATLSSIRLFLHPHHDAAQEADALLQSKRLLDEAIGKVRSLSHQLQPVLLQRLGLSAALQSLADTLRSTGSLDVSYSGSGPMPKLAPETELAIYRIVQELVTNAIRHGSPTALWLEWGPGSDGAWRIALLHNGTGLTQDGFESALQKPGAIGLKNIANRVALIGATLRLERRDDNWHRAEICGRLPG